MKYPVVIAILLSWMGTAGADIIEWQDTDGVRHYTNLKAEVPKEQEGSTRVVVDELARQSAGASSSPVVAEPAAEPVTPRHDSEVVDDPSQMIDAYVRGLQQGLDVAGLIAAGDRGGGVQINGPLAVTQVTNPAPYASPAPYYDGFYPGYYPFGYYPFGYYGVVGTPFHRGHARHRGLPRQRQFQSITEREAVFLFHQTPVSTFGTSRVGRGLDPFPGTCRTASRGTRK